MKTQPPLCKTPKQRLGACLPARVRTGPGLKVLVAGMGGEYPHGTAAPLKKLITAEKEMKPKAQEKNSGGILTSQKKASKKD